MEKKWVKQQKTWQPRQIVHHILNWIQTQLFAKTRARKRLSNYFTYRADINRRPNITSEITDDLSLQNGLIQAQETHSGIISQMYENIFDI